MPQPRAAGQLTVALVGQPNVGKSTVFNMLTGLSQHVGNWPGKTVEQKTGTLDHDGVTLDLVDLPGTYSLTANSEEERIARDYLIREKPDLVIAIVNAAALERSLYLTAELLALDALERRESCGGHFREESQTPDNEALRDDERFSYAAAWAFTGVGRRPELHQEALSFEYVKPTQRSYK